VVAQKWESLVSTPLGELLAACTLGES